MNDVIAGRDVDGGWAWVVLLAAALILALQEAYTVSVGIFQVEFLEAFSGSQGYVALIGALSISFQVMLGPVAGVMTDFLTHRVTVMIGAALKSLALLSASFSQDLSTLLLLFGVLTGTGAGLCYSPSITVISTHFHKYRTLANGLTLSAPGVGLLGGSYLLRWLIDSYGWRLAMAAFGGLMAQICVLGALFFPHKPANSRTPTHCPPAHRLPSRDGPAPKTSQLEKDTNTCDSSTEHYMAEREAMLGLETKLDTKDGSRTELEVKTGSRTELQILSGSRTELEVKAGSRMELGVKTGSRTELEVKTGSRTEVVRAASRTDLESNTGSRTELQSQPVPSRSVSQALEFGSVVLNRSVECLKEQEEESQPLSFRQRVTRLLCHKFIWIVCLNQLLMMSGHSINVVLYPAFVRSKGVGFHHLPALYTAYGITTSGARIIGGFLFSAIPEYLMHVFFGLQVALAVVFALLPVYGVSLPALFVGAVMVGLTYGPSFLLLSPIIFRYVGLTNLSIAFGLVMLSGGIAFSLAPAIAGVTYDILHSYSASYYIAGSTVGAGALPLLLLLLIKDLEPPKVKDIQKEALISTNQKDCGASARDTEQETTNSFTCDTSTSDGEHESTNRYLCDTSMQNSELERANQKSSVDENQR